MPLVKEIKVDAGIIGIWEMTEDSPDLIAHFPFTPGEITAFNQLKLDKRKKEFLSVRLMTNQLLKTKTEIIYEPTGKPRLKNGEYSISISHSRNLAAVFLSQRNGGIDVEDVRRDISPAASRFLSEREAAQIAKYSSPSVAQIIYWSAKEALFKCSPGVNINFKSQIQIHPFETGKEGTFRGDMKISGKTICFDMNYFFHKNNIVVYCVEVEK